MEYFAVILTIGAVAVAFHTGLSLGRRELLREQKRAIDDCFAVGSDDAFRRTYGLAGLYVSDIHRALLRTPLVIIRAADFLDFVAGRRAGPAASGLELKQMRDRLAEEYALNKGMSPATLAAIKRL